MRWSQDWSFREALGRSINLNVVGLNTCVLAESLVRSMNPNELFNEFHEETSQEQAVLKCSESLFW